MWPRSPPRVAVAAVVVVLAVTGGGSSHAAPRAARVDVPGRPVHAVPVESGASSRRRSRRSRRSASTVSRVQVLWVALAPDPLATKPPPGFNGDRPERLPGGRLGAVRPDGAAHAGARDGGQLRPHGARAAVGDAPGRSRRGDGRRLRPVGVTLRAVRDGGRSQVQRQLHARRARTPDRFRASTTWSIWNEPNQPAWLAPQLRTVAGARVPDSPRLYREYADAGFKALSRGRPRPFDRHGADRRDRARGVHRARSRVPVPRRRSADRAAAVPALDVLRRQQLQAVTRLARGRAPLPDQRRAERVREGQSGAVRRERLRPPPYSLLLAPNVPLPEDRHRVRVAREPVGARARARPDLRDLRRQPTAPDLPDRVRV